MQVDPHVQEQVTSQDIESPVQDIESPRIVMSQADYKQQREAIRLSYGENKTEAGIRFEQALAKLFFSSGWSQEQLAKEEGKTRQHIARLTLFGRFLNFAPDRSNPEKGDFSKLSEWTFRNLWSHTQPGGNERIRFLEVIRLIEHAHLSAWPRRKIVADIKKQFADGKWHRIETIAHRIDAPPDHVEDVLGKCCAPLGYSAIKGERRKSGKHNEYRLFRKERVISSEEIATKLSPIIEHLEEQSKRAAGTISGASISMLAGRLNNLLKEWCE
jgi:transcriptional regulator with XRE-family HTH domain